MTDADLLRALGESPATRRRFALLQAIAGAGSISQAAKAVGMSYKGAWDAIDALNNAADAPLVHRQTGGRRGGGTVLTARGTELLALYERLRAEQQAMATRIAESHAHAARDLPVLGRLTMLSSARNQLAGRVRAIDAGAVNDRIVIELAGGQPLVATITRESTRAMALAPGTPVTALIKAPWLMLATLGDAGAGGCSAENQLDGVVRRIDRGAVNGEVVLELAGGQTLVAVVTIEAIERLGLARGGTARALFAAASVILVRLG
ncbi:MAG: TOBE domain-containing protein [Gammaproteobacteria bacterium]|jgi:molybdate transport system regulatory protein|nr:TOBE domain-containing protein [Gammaproteobacteria bacterium]